jgi:V/A-type H+/Na+-transporting ATPase subunit K
MKRTIARRRTAPSQARPLGGPTSQTSWGSRIPAALIALTLFAGLAATSLLLWSSGAMAAADAAAATKGVALDSSWGLIGAALATGLSSLGAGFAVAKVGTAAVGALAEKPELFGRLLIFIGLAEGIAIYGLIVSILILNRLA